MPIIRNATLDDIPALTKIYNYYIQETIITFEETPVTNSQFAARFSDIQAKYPFLVAVNGKQIVGYAYASQWREKSAYQHAVESTVYLQTQSVGSGIGTLLYSHLLSTLKENNFKTALGCIALPNASSVGLHEKLGFKNVGHFESVGYKFNQWIDVGYWQILL